MNPPLPDPDEREEVGPSEVARLAERIAAREVILVDCRESEEWSIAHLPGARLVPLSEFPGAATLLIDSGLPCIVYCHHGMRSLRATRWLRAQGLVKTFSMAGGIDRWAEEIDPSTPRY